MDAVRLVNLRKDYGGFPALRDLSFSVPAGCLFGFLGPNGAGKTTTIRILMGLLRASGGRAELFGRECRAAGAALRRDVGYLPGDVRFYDHLRGRDVLHYFDSVRGGGSRGEIARLAGVFELDLAKRIRGYSRGMKQKLGLMQALMHRPRLLILDEPTTALDPLVRQAVTDELRAVAREGRTVLFSSHTLSEVEDLCERVAILRGGRLVELAGTEELRRRAVRRVEVLFASDAPRPPPPAALVLEAQDAARVAGSWSGAPDELIAWLAGCRVRDVTISTPSLEDLFHAYYNTPESATP